MGRLGRRGRVLNRRPRALCWRGCWLLGVRENKVAPRQSMDRHVAQWLAPEPSVSGGQAHLQISGMQSVCVWILIRTLGQWQPGVGEGSRHVRAGEGRAREPIHNFAPSSRLVPRSAARAVTSSFPGSRWEVHIATPRAALAAEVCVWHKFSLRSFGPAVKIFSICVCSRRHRQQPSQPSSPAKPSNHRPFQARKSSLHHCRRCTHTPTSECVALRARSWAVGRVPVGHQILVKSVHLLHVRILNGEAPNICVFDDPLLFHALGQRHVTML